MADSKLAAKKKTSPPSNGVTWDSVEAAVEILADAVAAGPTSAPVVGTTAATPYQAAKTVALTTVPEAVAAATRLVDSVVLYGQKARATNNTSTCYVGFTNVDGEQLLPITAGSYISLSAPPGKKIDLAGIYVDVGTNGDGVVYMAFA